MLISVFCIWGLHNGEIKAVEQTTTNSNTSSTAGIDNPTGEDRPELSASDRKFLISEIQSQPESSEKWAIDENEQFKRDALFQLMTSAHTKDDVMILINQFPKEKSLLNKQNILDALSSSPFKEIIMPFYKKVAKNENEDLFIRGFAIESLIIIGYEKEGLEDLKLWINAMNTQDELPRAFHGFGSFKSAEVKNELKTYLINLKDDEAKKKAIRCFAAMNCENYYKTDIKAYFDVIKEVLIDKNTKKNTAIYLLDFLNRYGATNAKAQEILHYAASNGNETVKQVADLFIRIGSYPY
jgi:hypothetical protein